MVITYNKISSNGH